ncbi:MAG: Wzz/FepE/Etk N-terminal domain-containing protein [Gemmatimonadaceae bacterium]
MRRPEDDALELGPALGTLWRARWRLLAWVGAGAAVAIATLWFLPRRWEARATVIASSSNAKSSLLSRSGISDLIAGSLLGGSDVGFDTELELLRSRRLLREVTAELPLAVKVRSPETTPATTAITAFVPSGQFAPARLVVRPDGANWRLQHAAGDTTVRAGAAVTLPEGTLQMAESPGLLAAPLVVHLLDDEDTMRRLARRVTVARVGGAIAGVTVRWDDSVTGARIANAIVRQYVAWRRTSDRGENAMLGDFLRAQSDSIDAELARALDVLRAFQERSEYADPTTGAKALLEALTRLRTQLGETTIEEAALNELLARLTEGGGDRARELPAFPPFLNSPGINDLLGQLNRLEAERVALLQTRTARDPGVVGRTEGIRLIESQLVPLARTYGAALTQNRLALRASADSLQRLLGAIPGTGRRFADLTRDVERLGEISRALQIQLVQARLVSIGEGGGAEQIDEAIPSRAPASPNVPLIVLLGIGAGAALGVVRELLRASPSLDTPAT